MVIRSKTIFNYFRTLEHSRNNINLMIVRDKYFLYTFKSLNVESIRSRRRYKLVDSSVASELYLCNRCYNTFTCLYLKDILSGRIVIDLIDFQISPKTHYEVPEVNKIGKEISKIKDPIEIKSKI